MRCIMGYEKEDHGNYKLFIWPTTEGHGVMTIGDIPVHGHVDQIHAFLHARTHTHTHTHAHKTNMQPETTFWLTILI